MFYWVFRLAMFTETLVRWQAESVKVGVRLESGAHGWQRRIDHAAFLLAQSKARFTGERAG